MSDSCRIRISVVLVIWHHGAPTQVVYLTVVNRLYGSVPGTVPVIAVIDLRFFVF